MRIYTLFRRYMLKFGSSAEECQRIILTLIIYQNILFCLSCNLEKIREELFLTYC